MTIRVASLACAVVVIPCIAAAEEISGEIALGWRTVSVSGTQNKYDEDINLDDGPRLFSASLVVQQENSDPVKPDLIELVARNLGGDPFESARLSIRKYGAYAFSAQRRRSAWFYDDLLVLPENASVTNSTGGDFHRFNVERVRDDVSLSVQVNDRAKLLLGFERNAKSGISTTTLDISRDEFELDKPVDELLSTWRLGFDYRWANTALSLEERVSDFENNASAFLPGFSTGENTTNLTTLDFYFLDSPYSYRNREHVVRLKTNLTDRLQLSAAVLAGQLDLTTEIYERAQGIAFNGNPIDTNDAGGGSIERDNAAIDLDLAFALNDKLSLNAGLERRTLEQSGNVAFSPFEGGTGTWDIDSHAYSLGLSWQAADGLAVSAGWQVLDRETDSVRMQTGETPLSIAQDSKVDDVFVNVSYRASARLSFTARLNDRSQDDPYSLASPAELTRVRLQARYRSGPNTQITASHAINDRDNDAGQWSASTRQSTLRIHHVISDVTLSLGATIIDSNSDYQRLVSGGSRQDLFDVHYVADTSYIDAGLRWAVDERWSLGGHWRHYDNDGSFNVSRKDRRAFVDIELPKNYALSLGYRATDYREGGIEAYDARIFEAVIRLRL